MSMKINLAKDQIAQANICLTELNFRKVNQHMSLL